MRSGCVLALSEWQSYEEGLVERIVRCLLPLLPHAIGLSPVR